ncbi:MAG: sugar ABC transporter ATP-binding protein [Vallitaleaceae bacterium]|nr:sugar ABC transporter ATP-binding protein [Vallitaleaceae bacterium]
MSEYILELENLCKNFFAVSAAKNVSLKIKKGKLISLIGENGAGKSTIMNMIGGVIQPSSGKMFLNGKPYEPKKPADADAAGIAFIHQELNLFANLSILDNIYITSFPKAKGTPIIAKKAIRKRVEGLLKTLHLEVSPDVLVEKLSLGERQLVEIAKAINSDPEILIFDEPTTSLTNQETEKLFQLIEQFKLEGKSIIYISHILEDVYKLSDEIVVLRDGEVTDVGSIESFTIDRMITSMVGRELKQLYPERGHYAVDEVALEVRGLSQSGTVKDISFKVHKGEIVGVFGLMGAGRSELARIIFGIDPYEKGEILINGKMIKKQNPLDRITQKLAFITENRREEGLMMDLSILDNVSLVALRNFSNKKLQWVNKEKMSTASEEKTNQLKLKSGPIQQSTPKSLSGGNQQKVVIGKWLLSEPEVLIVDEPTRGIDVAAKSEVHHILKDLASTRKGVLMISSELEELIGMCDRILVMCKGEIVGEFKNEGLTPEIILRSAFRQK